MSKRRTKNLLQKVFFHVVSKYCKNKKIMYKKWNKIMFNYQNDNRPVYVLTNHLTGEQFYVNMELKKIENKLLKLLPFKDENSHWDSIILAIYYAKFINDGKKSSNRKKSALFGSRHMKSLGIPQEIIVKSVDLILSKAI